MDRLLYVAMTGAVHNNRAQTAHSNNLANAGTTAFKADFAQARSMQVFGETHPTRVYALTERPGTDLTAGALASTGNPLDIAVQGEGWLAVQAPDGSEAYTRAGDLTIDAQGMLRTGTGLPVLGEGGPVALPPIESLLIGADGTITVRPEGQGPEALVQIDRLKLVNPEALEKGTDGLLRTRDGAAANPDPDVRVVSGYLEESNVNPVTELTSILELARQFEVQVKLMKTAEQMDESSARILQS